MGVSDSLQQTSSSMEDQITNQVMDELLVRNAEGNRKRLHKCLVAAAVMITLVSCYAKLYIFSLSVIKSQ
jgi:hypothetical protein